MTQQARIKDDRYGSRDNMGLTFSEEAEHEESELDDEDDVFRLYHPGRWASNALNAVVRLLIFKLSRQQLCDFRYVYSRNLMMLYYCNCETLILCRH